MSLGLCVGACDCMTVDVVDSCMHLKWPFMRKNYSKIVCIKLVHLPYLKRSVFQSNLGPLTLADAS